MSDFHSLIRLMKRCGELQGRAQMFEGAGAQAPRTCLLSSTSGNIYMQICAQVLEEQHGGDSVSRAF